MNYDKTQKNICSFSHTFILRAHWKVKKKLCFIVMTKNISVNILPIIVRQIYYNEQKHKETKTITTADTIGRNECVVFKLDGK